MSNPEAGPPPEKEPVDLTICGECDSYLVYPTYWQEAGKAHWEVDLRCPGCENCTTGVFDQATVERFDKKLDQGTEALVRDLKRLVVANMARETEIFAQALHGNQILPEDF